MSPEVSTAYAHLAVTERLERERDDAQCEVARLGRENDRLCDEVDHLRARLAEIGVKYAALQASKERAA